MKTTKAISIIIAEDHIISRMGTKMLLEQVEHFRIVDEAEDGKAAVEKTLQHKPNVVIMDLEMPEMDGIEATARIKASLPDTHILICTSAEDDESIFAALKAGADGYCTKNIASIDKLSAAIHSVMEGAVWLDPAIAQTVLRAQADRRAESDSKGNASFGLTESKLKLLSLVEQGKGFEEIAKELNINDSLVKGLLKELLEQLQDAGTKVVNTTGEQSTARLEVGELLGEHYKIQSRLGVGGMGMVYKAAHTFIDRTVAVKTLHEHLASDPPTLERFKLEAEASSRVNHPNLITIYDFGLWQKRVPYIVMEYLDGYSLNQLLDEIGRIQPLEATKIFIQVCDALSEVHNAGIVHRDLKPSNIMLIQKENDPYFVKLVDFGIAKVLESKGKSLTQTGEAIGSPPYMSPEHCNGSELDTRSDIYSLGCVMYETYTGLRAFPEGSPVEIMMKHIQEMPSRDPFTRWQGAIPQQIESLIFAMLGKDKNQRPQTIKEVGKYLTQLIG